MWFQPVEQGTPTVSNSTVIQKAAQAPTSKIGLVIKAIGPKKNQGDPPRAQAVSFIRSLIKAVATNILNPLPQPFLRELKGGLTGLQKHYKQIHGESIIVSWGQTVVVLSREEHKAFYELMTSGKVKSEPVEVIEHLRQYPESLLRIYCDPRNPLMRVPFPVYVDGALYVFDVYLMSQSAGVLSDYIESFFQFTKTWQPWK